MFFHQGDIDHQGHCNNGWVIFKDYVLVIDAELPFGAQNILPKFAPSRLSPFDSPSIRTIMQITHLGTR